MNYCIFCGNVIHIHRCTSLDLKSAFYELTTISALFLSYSHLFVNNQNYFYTEEHVTSLQICIKSQNDDTAIQPDRDSDRSGHMHAQFLGLVRNKH